MSSILVTGGLGFIGGHLVHELLGDAENHVVAIDNLLTNVLPVEDLIGQIQDGQPGKLDVEIASVADYRESTRFKTIYHLASVVGPAGVLDHAGHITEAIVRDVYCMVRLAQEHGARLVYVSTSEVYGGGKGGLCSENDPRVVMPGASARMEYAAAKLACEVAVENLCRADRLDAVIIRPFNVAGPRQVGRGGFVLPRFIGQALTGQPLTVFGDGRQLRAFTDVRDVAQGMMLAAQKGSSAETYNVGNPGNRISSGELASLIISLTGAAAGKTNIDPRSIYGPAYREAEDKFPNADKLLALGWRPRFDIATTVRSVHQFMAALPRPLLLKLAGLAPANG